MTKVTRCLYCGNDDLTKVTHRSDHIDILECSGCKLMMVDLINDDTASLYTKDYFEKETSTGFGYNQYLTLPVANLVGKFAFAHLFATGKKHLDIGCADGSLMEVFVGEGYQTQGLDISDDAVNIARARGLSATVTNLREFPEQATSLDIVTAFDLLEHSDCPGVVLKNVFGGLSQGGVFVFSTLSVRHRGSSEYWFNHSLEHYTYYTKPSLTRILEDIFGKGNFGFIEVEVNGVAEFWGFAKKGTGTQENKLLTSIDKGEIPSKPDKAYYFSLYYNQISRFGASKDLIDKYESKWQRHTYAEAIFYHYYQQGKFASALNETKDIRVFVPVNRGVFWQALASAESANGESALMTNKIEGETEILALKEQIFKLRDELRHLTHSRVLGRIIKARNFIGDKLLPGVRTLSKKVSHAPSYYAKEAVIAVIPKKATQKIVTIKRSLRERLERKRGSVLNAKYTEYQVARIPKEDPILSIVIPYYNRADMIDDTLNSLEGQTFRRFEVIIVDDGSTDEASKQAIEGIGERHSTLNIRIVRQENLGVAKARNNGIKSATGKYIICLDSDDILTSTYVEKCVIALETNPDIALVTSYREHFGVVNSVYSVADYDAMRLYDDNMVTTAAAFRKEAWARAGGYKSGISYEDWEFWLTLAENGDWGMTLQEPLFRYRVELQSRFQQDKNKHWDAMRTIKNLHPNYKKIIATLAKHKKFDKHMTSPKSAFGNLSHSDDYIAGNINKPAVLVAIPWMTFGGAETLIYNYCREIKNAFDISFVTGISSDNEWHHKFLEISERIYHLPRLLPDEKLYFEFISNYIDVHNVDILHIIHSGFVFDMLPRLKELHPNLKVVVTMFNDRVEEYVNKSVEQQDYIDEFNTDSEAVAESYRKRFTASVRVRTIPNGIDCYKEFNPDVFDRDAVRTTLGIKTGEKAVFFIGRLSEEKNPDVFVEIAKLVGEENKTAGIAKFFMIGDGPMKKEIEHMIHKERVGNLTYLGYQSNIAEYLSAADIFVLPSRIEGFPLSILEAMSMGVAVVASAVGAVPDVVVDGHNGYVIEPGSVDQGAEKVRSLMNDTILHDTRINNRKDVEQKYSNKKLGENYRKLYKEALK